MQRTGAVKRETRETSVEVVWALDGSGTAQVSTGLGFLDHMLQTLARHGFFDITVSARGDLHVDPHHTVEDVAICLGRALDQALGERRGIRRFGHAIVPLDESLAMVAVDLAGRGASVVHLPLGGPTLGVVPTELFPHFLQSLAAEARMALHVQLLRGENDHHKVEAAFKALARALDDATRLDPRLAGEAPSTKGTL